MLRINQSTSKQSLFKMLEQETTRVGELEVIIDSLPAFMSTQIALNIFSYQIDKYPRSIVWRCQDRETAELIHSAGFRVARRVPAEAEIDSVESQPTTSDLQAQEPNTDLQNSKTATLESLVAVTNDTQDEVDVSKEVKKEETSNDRKVVEGNESHNAPASTPIKTQNNHWTGGNVSDFAASNRVFATNKPEVEKTSSNKPKPTVIGSKPPKDIKDNQLVLSVSPRSPQKIQSTIVDSKSSGSGAQGLENKQENSADQESSGFNAWQTWFKPRDRLSALNLTNRHQYTPSSLLGNQETQLTDGQDLDQWLKNVHTTKAAIDNLRRQNEPEGQVSIASLKQKRRARRRLSKNFQLITGAVLTTCLMVLFLLIFPANVYTVELESPLVEDAVEVDVQVTEFIEKPTTLSAVSTIEATGRKEVETVNATGKAILINRSGNELNLTNGGFYLVANGRKYKHEYDANRPRTITIPSRNDLNGPTVEIRVRAVDTGASANLPEDTRFSVINLKEQNVGNALFGISTTPIQNKELSGDKVVTQSDLDLLKSTNEGKIAQEIGKEISNVQAEGVFTNADWYVRTETEEEYDAQVGQTKSKVTLDTNANVSLYYLPQDVLAEKIKLKNEQVDEVVEIVIKGQSGDFQLPENLIRLDMFYSYRELPDLDTGSVSQTLSEEVDFNEAEQKLKEQYPYIKNIEKEETGLSMPMVKPRIDINIVE